MTDQTGVITDWIQPLPQDSQRKNSIKKHAENEFYDKPWYSKEIFSLYLLFGFKLSFAYVLLLFLPGLDEGTDIFTAYEHFRYC